MNVVMVAIVCAAAVSGLAIVGILTRSSAAMAVLLAAAFAVASVPLLLSDPQKTSTVSGRVGDPEDPVDFFADRVADRPNDVSARLDLAAELLSAGNFKGAMTEYLAALQLDPANAGAHARVGLLLFRGGLTKPALRAVDRALTLSPDLPEGLYVKGLVTTMGLKRPAEGRRIFRRYLEVAPFGAYVEDVLRLLEMTR
ncbi:MAG TPA: tetratricopeptide repeat protein [Actinomycetota bacterium]|nr:tetratricopeptide repeat protein [Actinomycetota bacterium]